MTRLDIVIQSAVIGREPESWRCEPVKSFDSSESSSLYKLVGKCASVVAHLPGGVMMLYASKGAGLVTQVIWNTHKHTCTRNQQLAAGSGVIKGTRCQSWLQLNSRRLNPKAPSALGASLLHLKAEVSYQIAAFSFKRRAVASSWSLCLGWHVCRNSWPLSSALTAVLVTTGTRKTVLPRQLGEQHYITSESRLFLRPSFSFETNEWE